ncbi:MAG: MerR family transcriptional regulator [Treponemataceae bacterium]
MKDWYTAGEIASLFDLNIQTLHYYESIGLFEPMRRRSGSLTRCYLFDQVYQLATIRFLKRLNYPLKRIRENLDSRDIEYSLKEMRAQSKGLDREIDDLRKIKDAIDRKVRFVEARTASLDAELIEQKEFSLRRYLPIGIEDVLYRNDSFYFYPTIVFYEKTGKRFGALLTDEVNPEVDQFPRTIDPGTFLVGFHRGSYDHIPATFDRLRSAAKDLEIQIADESVNVNIIDQFVERDAEKFITEVQMRIIQ